MARRESGERSIVDVFAEEMREEEIYIYLPPMLHEALITSAVSRVMVRTAAGKPLNPGEFQSRPFYRRIKNAARGHTHALEPDATEPTEWEKVLPLFDVNPMRRHARFVSLPDGSAMPVEVFRIWGENQKGLGEGVIVITAGLLQFPLHVAKVRRSNAETARRLNSAKTLRAAMMLRTLVKS